MNDIYKDNNGQFFGVVLDGNGWLASDELDLMRENGWDIDDNANFHFLKKLSYNQIYRVLKENNAQKILNDFLAEYEFSILDFDAVDVYTDEQTVYHNTRSELIDFLGYILPKYGFDESDFYEWFDGRTFKIDGDMKTLFLAEFSGYNQGKYYYVENFTKVSDAKNGYQKQDFDYLKNLLLEQFSQIESVDSNGELIDFVDSTFDIYDDESERAYMLEHFNAKLATQTVTYS